MSNIAPRPPQPPPVAHARARSEPPAFPDKRLELVGKLEGCIRDVLDATQAFKCPQPQSAHQNANQMFQQRVMASQAGSGGDVASQDWVGTMMQCLNESMKTQQSSFVRNTTLDVALKAFAAGAFDILGLTYFQEPFDKFLASRQHAAVGAAIPCPASAHFGIPSPPREMGPGPGLMQRPGPPPPPPTQGLLRAPAQPPTFPSAHHQVAQRPHPHVCRPTVMTHTQEQLRGMPVFQPAIPSPLTPVAGPVSAPAPAPKPRRGRPPKRPSPSAVSSPISRKRVYTSEALRQAAGPMGPPPPPPPAAQVRSSAAPPPPRPRLCIDVWNVQQERDPRRRQAILGYGGKWYVFQCHQHGEVLFFKTADGARHHMLTRHASPHQHVDFLDIVRELGVEVMHCDSARAEQNNLDAVHLWNFAASSSASPVEASQAQQQQQQQTQTQLQLGMVARREVIVPVQAAQAAPVAAQRPGSASRASPAVRYEPVQYELAGVATARPRRESPGVVLVSDDEEEEQAAVTIKREREEATIASIPATMEQERRMTPVFAEASALAGRAIEVLEASRTPPVPVLGERKNQAPTEPVPTSKSLEKRQIAEPLAKDSVPQPVPETPADKATVTRETPEKAAEPEPDSPQSSELSEAPSLQELEPFAPAPAESESRKATDDELEEGEITESTIEVAPWPPVREAVTASPDSGKTKRKRRISGATSAAGTQRKKLPWTPKPSQKRRPERKSLWSPPQEGPSAHDQFKTRACKKCSERFYFRAQLATHMMSEHPEVV